MEQPAFDYNADVQDYSPTEEDALRIAMQKRWVEDQQEIRERGVFPDWLGEPSPLSKDKARLLTLLYDVGHVKWTQHPGQNNRNVTRDIGLRNVANAKAVIDMCLKDNLVSSREYRGNVIIEMTQAGEFALDEYQLEVELGILSV